MIGALNNGKIGLLSFENAISVESNNVSNATTIGHKEDNVTFEDMMYKNGYGKGVNIQNVEKSFSQGNVQLTNVNLDVAIEGKGMFVINDRSTGLTYYTRAGNFQQGEDGFLETQELFKVQGLSPQEKILQLQILMIHYLQMSSQILLHLLIYRMMKQFIIIM